MDINIFYLLEKDTQGMISCLCQLNFYEIQMRKVSRFRRPRTIRHARIPARILRDLSTSIDRKNFLCSYTSTKHG